MANIILYALLPVSILSFPITPLTNSEKVSEKLSKASKATTDVNETLSLIEDVKDPVTRERILIRMYLKEKAEAGNLREAIGGLKNTTERAKKDAELAEFLLYFRHGVINFENQNTQGMQRYNNDEKDKKFIRDITAEINKMGGGEAIDSSQLKDRFHFKNWVFILFKGDTMKCESIAKLREALGNDCKKYIWFAKQMQNIFEVCCGDVHGMSPFDVRHLKMEKLLWYARFFAREPRDAVSVFIKSVYFPVN